MQISSTKKKTYTHIVLFAFYFRIHIGTNMPELCSIAYFSVAGTQPSVLDSRKIKWKSFAFVCSYARSSLFVYDVITFCYYWNEYKIEMATPISSLCRSESILNVSNLVTNLYRVYIFWCCCKFICNLLSIIQNYVRSLCHTPWRRVKILSVCGTLCAYTCFEKIVDFLAKNYRRMTSKW